MRAFLCLLVLLPCLAQAEVFRWTDENGKVHYGDRPLGRENSRVRGLIDPTAVDPLPKPGMKAEDLRAKYGEPERIHKVMTKDGETEIWGFVRSKRVKQDFAVKIQGGEVVEVATDTGAQQASPASRAQPAERAAAMEASQRQEQDMAQRDAAEKERSCNRIREAIERLDNQARRGGSAGSMDYLREEKRRYSDQLWSKGC